MRLCIPKRAERINPFPTIFEGDVFSMELKNRKNIRIPNFDYGNDGAYFITICTKDRKKILSDIVGDEIPKVRLTKLGEIVKGSISDIEAHYKNVKVDKYIIMPDHIHMIVCINLNGTDESVPYNIKYDIPNVIGKFKASVTRNVGKAFMLSEKPKIWQSRYYDHVIRNQTDYNEIWEYIDNNPKKWLIEHKI